MHRNIKEIEFIFYLSAGMEERLRVSAQKEKDKIIGFVVQFEAFIYNKWSPIVRYDTSHGFTHKDIIHPDGSAEKQPFYFVNFNLAFTFAIQDLKTNWRRYIDDYKKRRRWLR